MGAGYKAILKAVLKAQMQMLVGSPGEWGWGAGYKVILKAVLKAQMRMLVGSPGEWGWGQDTRLY